MTFFDLSPAGRLLTGSTETPRLAAGRDVAPWSLRTVLVANLCLVATAALAYARWRLEGAVVPWDSKNQFYAFFRFLGAALDHGTLPLWNPYQFAGYSVAADPQSLLFTPSLLLFAWLCPRASMQAFDAVIYVHLLLGGIGMLALARHWRWHPSAGVLAGLVYMLGGVASSRLQHTGMIISYAFFPMALLCLEAALDQGSSRLAIAAGLVTMLMALGRDQVAFLLCLALVGSVARRAFRPEEGFAFLRMRLPVLAVAAVVTLGGMIVPILLTLEYLHLSNRPGIPYGMALEGSLDPINLVTLLAPNAFGSLDKVFDYWGPGAATIAGNDWTDRSIDYLFAGTLPFVLLLWHGVAGRRLLDRGAGYFSLLLAGATVYALGRHTPLFKLAFDWLPGVSLYRRPADAAFLMNVAMAFISGLLLHRFIEDGLPRMRSGGWLSWLWPTTTLLGLALLIGWSLSFARQANGFRASLDTMLVAGGLALAVAGALLVFRRRRQRPLAAWCLVAATSLQLLWLNAASPLNAEPVEAYSAFATQKPDEAHGLALLRAELARRAFEGARPRVEILGVDGPWQNAAMVFGLDDTLGYNPLRIADYERAVGAQESANDPSLRSFPDTFRGYNSRLAALLGIEYLVIDRPVDDMPRAFPRPRATLLFAGTHFFLYRLDGPTVPRVHVATSVVAVDGDDIIADGTIPSFDLLRCVLVQREDAASLDKTLLSSTNKGDGDPGSAHIVSYADDRVVVDVNAPAAGVLVLHDPYYPGWTALVDGQRAPVLKADLIFRGVEVSRGHHTVEFAFHPLAPTHLASIAGALLRRSVK